MTLTKEQQWMISVRNSDWTDETIWNEIAKEQEKDTVAIIVFWLRHSQWAIATLPATHNIIADAIEREFADASSG